jgi:hypothetical protein
MFCFPREHVCLCGGLWIGFVYVGKVSLGRLVGYLVSRWWVRVGFCFIYTSLDGSIEAYVGVGVEWG